MKGLGITGSGPDAQPCSSAAWGLAGVVMVLVADSEQREGPWPGTGLGAQPVRTGRRRGRKQDQRCQREMGAGRQGAGERSQGRQCRTADHQGKWCAGEGRWDRACILDTGLQGALSSLLWAPGWGQGRFLPALLTPAVRRSS